MTTLYDQFNRPIESTKPPTDDRVLSVAPLMESARDYVAAGLTPKKLAEIFKAADSGDMARQSELFDQIEEKDAHIMAEAAKRRNVILDMDFTLTPASESQRDIEVADFIRAWMDNHTDWPETIISLQDAIGKGYSALEVNWDVSGGQALPESFEYIEQKRFIFYDKAGLLTRIPRLITDEEMMGMEIPPWRLMMHQYGGKSGHPTRSGIFRVCSWMYLFKNYSIKDWLTFCELCGIPIRLGKYDSGASKEDKQALFRALTSIGTAAAGVISKSTEITFVENKGTSVRSDMFEGLARFCNGESSKAILGQTLSADSDGNGSYALGAVHDGIRTDLMKADGRAIAATVRHQLLRPIVGFNYGWDTPVPGYKATWDEPEDLKAKKEWVEFFLGQAPAGKKWLYSQFNVPIPADDEETIGGPSAEGNPTGVAAKGTLGAMVAKTGRNLNDLTMREVLAVLAGDEGEIAKNSLVVAKNSEGDKAPDGAEAMTARMHGEFAGLLDGLAGPVRELVMGAKSLEEIRDGIFDLYEAMDGSELAEVMGQALAAANLAGRAEVAE